MANNSSPERWSVNGEVADEDQIAFMEGLASDMLKDIPAGYTRQYGYETDNGSIVLFSTIVLEDESERGSHAVAILAKGSAQNVVFAVPYGYDNQPGAMIFSPKVDYGEMKDMVDELTEADDVEPKDVELLRHMQAILVGRMSGRPLDHAAILRSPDQSGDYQYVGDVIRSQVIKKASSVARSKAWGMFLVGENEINVFSNELLSDLGDDDDPLILPHLEIEYVDRAAGISYKYIREQDGETSLKTAVTAQEEDDYPLTMDDEDIEEQVALFVGGLGASIPGEREVGILKDMLSQALLKPAEK